MGGRGGKNLLIATELRLIYSRPVENRQFRLVNSAADIGPRDQWLRWASRAENELGITILSADWLNNGPAETSLSCGTFQGVSSEIDQMRIGDNLLPLPAPRFPLPRPEIWYGHYQHTPRPQQVVTAAQKSERIAHELQDLVRRDGIERARIEFRACEGGRQNIEFKVFACPRGDITPRFDAHNTPTVSSTMVKEMTRTATDIQQRWFIGRFQVVFDTKKPLSLQKRVVLERDTVEIQRFPIIEINGGRQIIKGKLARVWNIDQIASKAFHQFPILAFRRRTVSVLMPVLSASA